MRKARAVGFLVFRADVIHDRHGNYRRAFVLMQQHFETVVELVFFKFDILRLRGKNAEKEQGECEKWFVHIKLIG